MKISRAIWASAATAVLALGWLVLPNTVKQAQALPGMQGGGTQGPAGADGAQGPAGTPGFGGGVNVSTGGPAGYIPASSVTVSGAIEQTVIGSSVNWKVNLSTAMNAISSTGTVAVAAAQSAATTAVTVATLQSALSSTGTTAVAAMQAASTAAAIAQSSMTNLASLGTVNTATNPMEWSKLKNVPAGFADGTDDGAAGSSTFTAVGVTDESTALGGASSATCSGAGITCTQAGGVWTLTVPGGSGGASSLETRVSGVVSSSPTATISFDGAMFTGFVSGSSITIQLNSSGTFFLDQVIARTLIVTSSISMTGAPGYVVSQTTEVGFSFNASPGSTFYILRSSIVADDFLVKLGSVTLETVLSTGNIYALGFFGDGSGLMKISSTAYGSIPLFSLSATGTRNASTFLRGDNTFSAPTSSFSVVFTVPQKVSIATSTYAVDYPTMTERGKAHFQVVHSSSVYADFDAYFGELVVGSTMSLDSSLAHVKASDGGTTIWGLAIATMGAGGFDEYNFVFRSTAVFTLSGLAGSVKSIKSLASAVPLNGWNQYLGAGKIWAKLRLVYLGGTATGPEVYFGGGAITCKGPN